MPEDAPINIGVERKLAPAGRWSRVSGMQTKLHHWAAADPGRRFDDLFNFVCDPATLLVAFDRVAGNTGANTPGVMGATVATMEDAVGVPGFLIDLRAQLKTGSFRPLPVRERIIPETRWQRKSATVGDPHHRGSGCSGGAEVRVEPIFEADFAPGVLWVSAAAAGARRGSAEIDDASAPRVIAGCWTLISKRVSTRSSTRPCWTGCANGSNTSACSRW